MAKVEAIIFDVFGVLITDALFHISDKLKTSDPGGFEEIRSLVHATSRGLTDRETSNQRIAEILDIGLDDYKRQINEGEVRNTQLLDYIKELRKSYKTAILSNISNGGIYHRFSKDELAEHFDAVVASGDEGFAKPEPEIYEIAADRLGVRLDACVFTDDIPAFCEAARSVGMRAVHYQDFDSFKRQLEKLLQT